MTRFLLLRHASADYDPGCLPGRMPGVHLDEAGREEARALAAHLEEVPLTAVYASPLERTRETAAAVAEPHGLEPTPSEAFLEVDVGEWTGMTFEELDGRPEWRSWNEFRSTARAPGGESMASVLERALDGLDAVRRREPDGPVAVVSHCDVIRGLLTHFLGMPLDHLLRLEVATASVSTVDVHPWGPRIRGVNVTPASLR